MGADLSKAKTGPAISAAEVRQTRARLAECEQRIETGLKSFAGVGAALAEIRDSRLYMLSHTTFEDYCEQRWELSRKRAYDQVAAAAVVSQICDKNMPPPAIESHAAALVKVPGDRRAEVWAKVREQTGGKPTAKAVAEAWEALKSPADPHKDLKAELAGKNTPVKRHRQSGVCPCGTIHGVPDSLPDQPGTGGLSVEDAGGKAEREPAGQVSGSMTTAAAETVTTTTGSAAEPDPAEPVSATMANVTGPPAGPGTPDPQPCPRCAPQIAEMEQLLAGRLAELETARAEIERLGKIRPDMLVLGERDFLAARVAELERQAREAGQARPSAAPVAADQAAPPTALQPEPETADSAHGNGQALSEPGARRGARTTCGAAGTGKFCFVAGGRLVSISMPDGRQAGELWLCGEHQEEMTERFGAEVDLDPAGDGGYDFDEPCQFPVRAEVPA